MKYSRRLTVSVDLSKTQVEKVLKMMKKCKTDVAEIKREKITESIIDLNVDVGSETVSDIANLLVTVEGAKGVTLKDVTNVNA